MARNIALAQRSGYGPLGSPESTASSRESSAFAAPLVYGTPPVRPQAAAAPNGGVASELSDFEVKAMRMRKEFCQFFLYTQSDQKEVIVSCADDPALSGRYVVDGERNGCNLYGQVNHEDPVIFYDDTDDKWKLNDRHQFKNCKYVQPDKLSKSATIVFNEDEGVVPPVGRWRGTAGLTVQKYIEVNVQVPQPEMKNKVISDWMNTVENLKEDFQRFDPAENEEQKMDALRKVQIYWAFVLPTMIPAIIDCLGSNSARFMTCLCTRIPNSHVVSYTIFDRIAMRRLQFAGTPMRSCVGEWNDITDDSAGDANLLRKAQSLGIEEIEEQQLEDEAENEKEERMWNFLAPKNPQPPFFSLSAPQKVEIQFEWCGIEGMMTDSLMDFKIVGSLSAQVAESGVFGPVASQAILQETWMRCKMFYYSDLTVNFAAVCCLFMNAYRRKQDEMGFPSMLPKPHVTLIIAAAINVESLVCHSLSELVMAYATFSEFRTRDPRTWFGPYLTFFTIQTFVLEVIVVVQSWNMVRCYWDDDPLLGNNYIAQHPVAFVLLLVAKWIQMLIGILASDFFGMTVLPAYYAMTSDESVRFLIYILLVLFMATQAYYSLPLEPGDFEAAPTTMNIFFISFVRMFRLCVLGDFDLFELEGIDAGINMSEPEDHFYAVDEPPSAFQEGPKSLFHDSLRWIFIFTSLSTTVVVMNMYIGILSMAYENLHERKVEMFSHQKARFCMRFMLRRRMMRTVLELICPVDCVARLFRASEPDAIKYDPVSEPEDEDTPTGEDGDVDIRPDIRAYKKIVRKQDKLIQDLNRGDHNHAEDNCALSKCSGFWTTVPAELMQKETTDDIIGEMLERQKRMDDRQDKMNDKLDRILQRLSASSF